MTSTASPSVAGPSPQGLTGRGPLLSLRRWFLATRPRFLTAAVLPVLVGTAWASRHGDLDVTALILAMLATALVAAASNVLNDVGDDLGGSDRINDRMIYPFTGGSRFIQNGIMTLAAMTRLSISLFCLGALIGVALIVREGAPVLWFGLIGVSLGVFYSLPPVQLAGRGVGELVVATAFGPLPIGGAVWLQTGSVSLEVLLLSVPVSCWVAAILVINEVPDIPADAAAGKRTLVVRLGLPSSALLYALLQGLALVAVLALALQAQLSGWFTSLPLGLFMLGMLAARSIAAGDDGIIHGIRLTLVIHATGCLWLAAWLVLA